MPRFPILALAVLVSCVLSVARRVVAEEPAAPAGSSLRVETYTSEHYALETNIDAATSRVYSQVLEALWPQLVAFFGAEPSLGKDDRLSVRFLAHRADWVRRMEDDGVAAPGDAGGYYSPATRRVYLFRQPTRYNSRQLLLHEAMHQFHFLARTHNTMPKDAWYVEGLVEHLSRHYWDGETLTLGVVPFCSLADYPAQALETMGQADYDLAAMVASRRPSTRAEQWALVRYLLTGDDGRHAKKFRQLARKLDAGQAAASVFPKLFGPPQRLLPKLRAWLATQQEPFVPIWNEWAGVAKDGVEGVAGVTSACRAREDVTHVAASLEIPEGPFKGGLLMAYEDNESYTVALLDDRGGYAVNRRVAGTWKRLGAGTLPARESGPWRLQATRGEGGVTLTANGTVLGTYDVPGTKMGVCLENCALRFSDIAWR
ncbi:MAG: hypothetical protein AB7T63_11955 [Planctomycetota bacterium]